jgi:tetratricopeptide (TPR) repeat protein
VAPAEDVLIDTAIQHHVAGRISEAEALYKSVLAAVPDQPEALNLLGLVLQDRGELTASVTLIERAIQADPAYPAAYVNLGRAQRSLGQPHAAVASARRAVELDPTAAEAHLLLGRALLDLKRPDTAVVSCRKALSLRPEVPDGRLTLGLALAHSGDLAGSQQVLREALERQPDHAPVLTALGITLSRADQHQDALPLLRRATELQPNEPQACIALARALGRSASVKEAIDACQAALALVPACTELWLQLATHCTVLGDFAAAERHLRKALSLDPGNAEALRELAAIGSRAATRQERHAMAEILADTRRDKPARIAAGFGLGALQERDGECDAAFACFRQVNALAAALRREEGRAFDRFQFQHTVDRLIATFTPGTFMATLGWGHLSERPVFIVGMPRSGTTLVEQIVASHPAVFGAGECKTIPRLLDRLTGGRHTLPPAAWPREQVARETQNHIAELTRLAPGHARVIDKLPDNIQAIGHIALLFPNARIIICRRDPRDICVSCYTQRFTEGIAWTHDLEDLAARTRAIEQLTAHWLRVAPVRTLQIRYESLISDLEAESQRLIDFLGLPWDPACLDYHMTQRPVLTASKWQVRQPIYTSSVGRWRQYRRHLGPLLAGLQGLFEPDEDACQQASAATLPGAAGSVTVVHDLSANQRHRSPTIAP